MRSRDEIALERFGCRFHQLSAWGKNEIIQSEGLSSLTMGDVDLAQALRVAHDKIAKLEQENKDLWEDNEDLQMRLYDYEDSDSRDAGRSQARARVRTDEEVSAVRPETPGIAPRVDNESE